jgi:TonB family protein
MKFTRMLGVALAVTLALPAAVHAGKAPLMTQVMVKVGAPEQSGAGPVVNLVPGTVIAVDSGVKSLNGARLWVLEDAKLSEQLETTFRIRLNPEKAASKTEALKPGNTLELKVADGAVLVQVSLDEIDGDLAAYRVAFLHDGHVLSETPVSVKTGSRAVVGARDGEKAPYLFVVLEPVRPGKDTPLRVTEGSGLTQPKLLKAAPPKYPEGAREDRVQGLVILETVISEKGEVERVAVLQSPDDRLGDAATEAVKTWRFEPARNAAGEAVSSIYVLTVKFRLQ